MSAERISKEKRKQILLAMGEGAPVNSMCRMFSVGKHALLRFMVEAAEAMEDWHDKHFRGLTVKRLEIDEQWSFVQIHKERMTAAQKAENPNQGDCWLWACIDADTKALISWKTGKRSLLAAHRFSRDIAARVDGPTQVTSDCLAGYRYAIPAAFGDRVNYATEKKKFHTDWKPDASYLKKGVDRIVGMERRAVKGSPVLSTATVCHIERYFLTTRHSNRRLTRKTIAHSRLWENHAAANSIHVFLYNVVRKHEALDGRTPAQAIGVTGKRWSLDEVTAMVDAFHKEKEDAAFESAFASSNFVVQPRAKRTYAPVKPKTPWYLDPHSGGKFCPADQKQADVDYTA